MVKPRLYNQEDSTREAALWTLKADITDTADSFFDSVNFPLIFPVIPFFLINRPLGNHDAFFCILDMQEQFFGL